MVMRAMTKAMLTVLELENFDEKIKNLSGGQKKRAALCKVLLQKPDILILDELRTIWIIRCLTGWRIILKVSLVYC